MKRIILTSISCTLFAFALSACKPSAPESEKSSDSSRPSVASLTKATQEKVEKAMRAVPQDAAAFAYYYPSASAMKFYFKNDAEYYKLLDDMANNKDLSEVYDLIVEKSEDSQKKLLESMNVTGIIGGEDGPTSIFVKTNPFSFLKKGEFKDLFYSYADFWFNFGVVLYVDKVDMAECEKTKFAALVFTPTDRLQKLLSQNTQDLKTAEVEFKSGKLMYYMSKHDDSVNPVFYVDAGRVIIADSAETLVDFADKIDNPKGPSILDNPKYKKLRAEAKKPGMGVFVDYKGISLDKRDMQKAMQFGMADSMLGLSKMDSMAIFAEEMTEKNIMQFSVFVSSEDDALFYELLKAELPAKDILKHSPKDSIFAASLAFPDKTNKVYTLIENSSKMMVPGGLENNPVYKAIKGNVKQIDVSVSDMENAMKSKKLGDGTEKATAVLGVKFENLGEFLALPEMAPVINFEKQGVFEVAKFPSRGNENSVLVKPDANSVVYANNMPAEKVFNLYQGKAESMNDLAGLKILSEKLGDKNAIEFYANYMVYFDVLPIYLDETSKKHPDSAAHKFIRSYIDFLSSAIKDYKIAFALKSGNNIISMNGYIYFDMDVNAFADFIKKADWASLKKAINDSDKN